MPRLKLGKRPATKDDRDLLFANYVKPQELPAAPRHFGHEKLFAPKAWGMLGNDDWGDCAWAGPAHETMLLTAEGGNPAEFMLKYRVKRGLRDGPGRRHKIGAYVKLTPKDLTEVYQAMYIFQAVGIGIEFPESAMDQFHSGKPWSVVPGAKVEGGHYLPCIAKRTNIDAITWGALQPMTVEFFETYCDEAWAYISTEHLQKGVDPEGFSLAQLNADLAPLK